MCEVTSFYKLLRTTQETKMQVEVKPYVYKLTHPETGEFYIGSRVANKEPWHTDLPKYRTSSKYVKPRFDEFDWQVLMIFEKPECAYDFEQYMIHEAWGDPLLLNKHCRWGSEVRFSTIGVTPTPEVREKIRQAAANPSPETREKMRQAHLGKTLSKEHREKIGRAGVGRKHSAEACEKIRQAHLGDNHRLGTKHSAETREKMRQAQLGRRPSAESREKMRLAHLGKTSEGARKANLGNTYRLGKTFSEESRAKMRQSRIGKSHSKEAREKIGRAFAGTRWYNNGEVALRAHECPEGFSLGWLRKPKKST
jgi:hypothetical protein